MDKHFHPISDRTMKDVYIAAFFYGNDRTIRPTLPLNKAIRYWQLFLPQFGTFKTFPDWCQWLQDVYFRDEKEPEVTLDLWKNFYDFAKQMQDDYVKNYNFAGDDGWNTALDQFVLDFLDLEVVPVNPF